jgi:hypothetical protein
MNRLNRQTRLDALFFHTQVPAILARHWLRKIPGIVSLDATPRQYDELGAFYKHEEGPAWLEAWKWRLRDWFRSTRRLVVWAEWSKLGLVLSAGSAATKAVSASAAGVANRALWAGR